MACTFPPLLQVFPSPCSSARQWQVPSVHSAHTLQSLLLLHPVRPGARNGRKKNIQVNTGSPWPNTLPVGKPPETMLLHPG